VLKRLGQFHLAFLDRYYNLKIDINDSTRGVDYHGLTRFALYEDEAPALFVTKILAFLHSYVVGLTPVKESTEDHLEFFSKNIVGEFETRVSVGLPEASALRIAIKQNENCRFAVYFAGAAEQFEFAKRLKGSKTNWIEAVDFYSFPEELVGEIERRLTTGSQLSLTIVDEQLYFELDGESFSGELVKLRMWEIYQSVLKAQAEAESDKNQ
jgi:hypothetical protein